MRQTAIVKHVGPGGASIEIGGTIIHSALLANTVPAQDLHPGDLVSIQWVDGKPHVVAVLTWRGEYHAVPDEVAPQIVSYEEGEPGSTVHGELFGLEEDDHDQYVHVGLSRVITAQHTIAPDSEMAPLALGEFAQGQTVIGLRADQLNKSVLAGNGLTGGGLLTDDVGLALDTPGTIGVSSTNEASGNHTHAVDHASNVQDGATKLLSSNAGLLVLKKLGVSGTPADGYLAKIGGSMELEGNLVFTGATREIQTSTGDLYLAPAGKTQSSKDLTFTGYNRVSEAYVSGAFGAGYAIGHTAAAGSYLEVDNVTVRGSLRTHIFQYDVVRATNGYLYIADASEITHPAEGSYIFVKHPVFQTGDLVWYKDFDLGSSQLISQVKMTVTGENTQVVKNGQTVYRYTVTVDDGSLTDLDAGGTVVRVGGSAQDRQGAVYIDAASQFSPFLDVYAGVSSWADFHSPSKVKARLGRLDGITPGTNEYGLLAGSGIADTDKYLRLSNLVARINNIPVMVYKGGNAVIVLDPDAPYLGVGAVAPTTWLGNPGFWTGLHDGAYKTYVGDNDGSRLQWDGSALSIYDANNDAVFSATPTGTWMSSLMVSESLGQTLFSQADGLALWGPGCELTDRWVSTRGHVVTLGGFQRRTVAGRWPGTRAIPVVRGGTAYNLVENPSAGANVTSYWSLYEGTRARSTTYYKYDGASFEITGAGTGQGPYIYKATAVANPAQGTVYTFSAWILGIAGTVGKEARIFIREKGGVVAEKLVYTSHYLTTGWHRMVVTHTIEQADRTALDIWVRLYDTTPGCVFYIDGFQLENGLPSPTAIGSMVGCFWDGTPHLSTTSRESPYVNADVLAPTMNGKNAFTLHLVAQAPYDSDCAPGITAYLFLADLYSSASQAVRLLFSTGGQYLYAWIGGQGGAINMTPGKPTPFKRDDWINIDLTLDFGTNTYVLYMNGKLAARSTTNLGGAPLTYDRFRIGTAYNSVSCGNWTFGEVAVFDKALTADEVAAIYALQRPLADVGATDAPGIWITDGRFTIASSMAGVRLELNNTRLAIGNGVGYKSGSGVWTGIDTDGAAKLFVGSSSGAHMDYDGTSLYLRASSSTFLKADGSLLEFYSSGYRRLLIDSSGSVVVGRSDAERVLISAFGVSLYSGGNRTGWWQSDGDFFLGSDVENAATTYIAAFAVAQNYNNQSFAAGDVLFGDNTPGKSCMWFDHSSGLLYFRAAQREMRMNEYGIQLVVPTSGQDVGIAWRTTNYAADRAYMKWDRANDLLRFATSGSDGYKAYVFDQVYAGVGTRTPLRITSGTTTQRGRVGIHEGQPLGVLHVTNESSASHGIDAPVLALDQRYTGGANQPVLLMTQSGIERIVLDIIGSGSGGAAATIVGGAKTNPVYSVKCRVNGTICYLNFYN